jgi:hypothetical protein
MNLVRVYPRAQPLLILRPVQKTIFRLGMKIPMARFVYPTSCRNSLHKRPYCEDPAL